MYEQLLRGLQSAGNAGEFYTPRAITEFMVHMTHPRLREKVMDPACGTGGFLSCSITSVAGAICRHPSGYKRTVITGVSNNCKVITRVRVNLN
jgi:hypothetical protein